MAGALLIVRRVFRCVGEAAFALLGKFSSLLLLGTEHEGSLGCQQQLHSLVLALLNKTWASRMRLLPPWGITNPRNVRVKSAAELLKGSSSGRAAAPVALAQHSILGRVQGLKPLQQRSYAAQLAQFINYAAQLRKPCPWKAKPVEGDARSNKIHAVQWENDAGG